MNDPATPLPLPRAAHAPPLYGLVLIGGQSRRMGQPKWALDYHGEPQAHRTARLLASVCERVFLSVRPGALPDGLPDVPTIADAVSVRGPSAGILSAMAVHPDAAWLVAAVDLPRLGAPTLSALVAGRDPARTATAFRSTRDGSPEPLCAVWEPAAHGRLLAEALRGATCPRRVLLDADVAMLDLPDPHALDNANTPDDRDAVLAGLARST